MTLLDVAERLDEFDDAHTIFAKRSPGWSATSEAVVCPTDPDDPSNPPEALGFDYFLEIDLAKDTVRVWSEWRSNKQPTTSQKLDAMLYYAEYDAWMPIDGQKPVKIDPEDAKREFISKHGGLSEERCRWHGCCEHRVEGLAFCYEHYFSRSSSFYA